MLALVTIGQSPRDDITQSMFGPELPDNILQFGALDALPRETIDSLAPRSGESLLVSTLRNGEEVLLAKQRLMPYVQQSVDVATRAGAAIVCILCTGEFEAINVQGAAVVTVDKILASIVNSLVPRGVLGVLSPHPDQAGAMEAKWQTSARAIHLESVSPYGTDFNTRAAVEGFRASGSQVVIMDCMGFDRLMQRQLEDALDCPVLLSNAVVGAVLRELVTVPYPVDYSLQVE